MKFLTVFVVLLIVLSGADLIEACPHYDEDGNVYYFFPDPDDNEIAVLMYIKDYHEHSFFYNMDFEIINEQFDIYLHHEDIEGFASFGIKLQTVEGINDLDLEADNYTLNVPVKRVMKKNR